MIRTVYHWKNIAKALVVLLAAAVGNGLVCKWVGLENGAIAVLWGLLVGMGSMMFALARWECWHFEFDEKA